MEIITRPFPLQELRQPGNCLQLLYAALAKTDASGDEPDYGVHITANWGRLTSDHAARMRRFIYRHRALTTFVSRRSNEEYASLCWPTSIDGKHTAARIRGNNALEVRTFQSTTRWPMLMSYAEYVDALTQWTCDPRRAEDSVDAAQFRYWVVASGLYPFLADRFVPKKEVVKLCA